MIWFYLFHACWAKAELWAYFTDWSGYTFKSQKGHTIEQPSSQGRILVKCLWKKTTFAEGQEPFGMAENLNLWGSVHPNSLHQPRASERGRPSPFVAEFHFPISDPRSFRLPRPRFWARPDRPALPAYSAHFRDFAERKTFMRQNWLWSWSATVAAVFVFRKKKKIRPSALILRQGFQRKKSSSFFVKLTQIVMTGNHGRNCTFQLSFLRRGEKFQKITLLFFEARLKSAIDLHWSQAFPDFYFAFSGFGAFSSLPHFGGSLDKDSSAKEWSNLVLIPRPLLVLLNIGFLT